jgi:hypothetical protein
MMETDPIFVTLDFNSTLSRQVEKFLAHLFVVQAYNQLEALYHYFTTNFSVYGPL